MQPDVFDKRQALVSEPHVCQVSVRPTKRGAPCICQCMLKQPKGRKNSCRVLDEQQVASQVFRLPLLPNLVH